MVFQERCDKLLEMIPDIRFAGLINHMGKLVSGGFKEGTEPLEDDAERRKMYMELALRVSMRRDFDYSLGPVKYSASRRSNVTMMSFPIGNKVLLISAEPDVDIDKTAQQILKIIGSTT
ncbi:MAG: hypothetical protein GWO20_04345 [Candidatus Korarchaeota archaeon]|nr:hypothetical protein [Candidatus Korarchaeota archaeon]